MNHNSLQSRSRRGSASGVAMARLAALCVLVACAWCGCAVTTKSYPVLSFFFDGVPDPNLKTATSADPTIASVVVVHAPYREEKCEACHKSQYRPSRNDASACLACHEAIKDKHAWTHGAVAGGACLWCHSPHESARTWLLRGPDRKLCAQCHSASMTVASTVPEHADPAVGCLSCHFGHGGDDPRMLKPGTALPPSSSDVSPPTTDPKPSGEPS